MVTSETTGPRRPLRLGVLGTLVWDTIHHPGGDGPVEAWGGIAYALTAFETTLPPNWGVVPVLKVGQDLFPGALEYLSRLERVVDTRFVRAVPEPNNRVELRYTGPSERTEYLRGGVPGWSAPDMEAVLPELDALYANFISGVEVDLATAHVIARRLQGPSFADLHSLFLDMGRDGRRRPRYLPSSVEWARCFDTVQMNEHEFRLFTEDAEDPWAVAATSLRGRLSLLVVTRGDRGADLLIGGPSGHVRHERIPTEHSNGLGDPTGCGDAWGATFFSRRLGGAGLAAAADRAHQVAALKLRSSGVAAFREALHGTADAGPETT